MKLRLVTLSLLLLAGCSSTPPVDTRPQIIQDAERHLDQGVTSFHRADYTTAASMFNRALAEYSSVDAAEGIIESHLDLAETALAIGRSDLAGEHIAQAHYLNIREGLARFSDRIALLQISVMLETGDTAKAQPPLDELIAKLKKSDASPQLSAAATLLRCRVAAEGNQEEFALWVKKLNSSISSLSEEDAERFQARYLLLKARLERVEGDSDQAAAQIQRALHQARKVGERRTLATILEQQAQWAQEDNDRNGATDALLRALYVRIWLMDRTGSRKVVERLAVIKPDSIPPEEIENWQQQLQSDEALDWKRLQQAFDYPYYHRAVVQP